ncbi:hypothetical protein ACNQP7_31755 [Mycolicibacterium fortuitum]|uniref:hypothetical protein n=1 Tax=Mycolicibacterium fortuitum TaxID=1766 RepID=UPI003AAF6B25
MTSPSDREVFLNEVREAIAAPLGLDNRDGDQMFEGLIDVTELAQAAIDAMVRHMGPPF